MEESCGSKTATFQNNYECAMCFEIFKEPILLPCNHMFCLKCLTIEFKGNSCRNDHESQGSNYLNVANVEIMSECSATADFEATESKTQMQPSTSDASQDKEKGANSKGSFSCPCCRRDIEVPERGIMAFPLNVDINHEELEKAKIGSRCLVHQDSINNIVCIDCDVIVCTACKIDQHLHHRSESIEDARKTARDQLLVEKKRIETICKNLQNNAKERTRKLTDIKNKRKVVEREIRHRCSMIIAEAEKLRDEALAALQTSDDEIANIKKDLDAVEQNLKEARDLCQRIDYAENSGDDCLLVTVAKEMTSGSGSVAATRRLTVVGQKTELTSLVHRSEVQNMERMFQMMRNVIGQCEVVRFASFNKKDDDDFVLVQKFQCKNYDNATVFCIKAKHDGPMIVSFDPSYHDPSPQAMLCYSDCCTEVTDVEYNIPRGTFSFTERLTAATYRKNSANFDIYAKSVHNNRLTWIFHRENDVSTIASNELVRLYPYHVNTGKRFSIESISCRALDVDQSQQYFVVVEESEKPATQRKVLLYRRPDTDTTVTAVDTYTSSITPFQPADVSFYTWNKQQVLLIADEANDALHVAEVKYDRVTFTRFLCPGCPLLLQPTALNTDHEGRLWVRCRGGRILTLQPGAEDNIDVNAQKA